MEMIAKGRFFCNQSRRMHHQDGVRCFFAIWRMERAEQKKTKASAHGSVDGGKDYSSIIC